MFMLAMNSSPFRPHKGSLLLQMFGYLFEYVLEHQIGIEPGALAHRAEGRRFLPARRHQRFEFRRQRLVARFRPLPEPDQVLLEPQNGIAQRPVLMIVLGSIARGVVAGGMRGAAIGDQLNQRGAGAGTSPFGRPLRDGMNREKVVAVDANARNAVAGA